MMIRSLFCACLLLLPISSARAVDCSIATSAVQIASSIRGLKALHPVPCQIRNREQVESYLRGTIEKKLAPGRIRHEELAYKLLGLIPQDFPYLDGLIKLYTSQIGGYYDPEQHYYAMAGWLPSAMQMPIAIHELTHALQDQHYQLAELIDQSRLMTDELMARMAVAEGDATAVMLDNARKNSGQRSLARETSVSGVLMQNVTSSMLSSAMRDAPPALQSMLVFPYISGLNFVHRLLREDGYRAVDRCFKHLPSSTAEVLHPERYLKKHAPFSELDDLALPIGAVEVLGEPVLSDRLGEFIVSTLLGNWLPAAQASQAAAGWVGDRLTLYEDALHPSGVLTWVLRWESEQEALEFFSAIEQAYEKRFSAAAELESGSSVWNDRTLGRIVLRSSGLETRLTIGVPQTTLFASSANNADQI